MVDSAETHSVPTDDESRRDFLLHATIATGVEGTAVSVWPLINSMNPAADTLALASVEVSLARFAQLPDDVRWRTSPLRRSVVLRL